MANITPTGTLLYVIPSTIVVYYVDQDTGVHKAIVTAVNVTIDSTNTQVVKYNIVFQNPIMGQAVAVLGSLYADEASALVAYQLLIT